MKSKPKILVVLGPTATGKSSLAVELAKKFDGEIISADSRQVYKGLNIGTGKVTKKEMKGILHHLLDLRSPKYVFSVSDFKKKAEKEIDIILNKNKLPIICGGTGFYIQALVDNINIPEVPANYKLRKELEKKSTEELFKILKKLDLKRAKNIDSKNPRRLIRAIEIAKSIGKVPDLSYQLSTTNYKPIFIGLDLSDKELKNKIHTRLLARVKEGMIAEAKRLRKEGLSLKRMEELGLEYKFLAKHLKGELSKEEMIEKLNTAIWQYAKRQRTWFKRDKRILWFKPSEQKKIEKEVDKFLN